VFLDGNWSSSTFVTAYVPVMLFPILYVAAKFIMGVQTVEADDMDFDTNVAEFDAMTYVPRYCRERHVRVTTLTSRADTMTPHRRTSWKRSGCG
jgi:amino acid permease